MKMDTRSSPYWYVKKGAIKNAEQCFVIPFAIFSRDRNWETPSEIWHIPFPISSELRTVSRNLLFSTSVYVYVVYAVYIYSKTGIQKFFKDTKCCILSADC
jgi:hypothetical protein